ncbi:MAG: hypothetical protein PHW77_04290 [Eubacteriales bacterium]|nr:hypothetical protein [Eubacteriales bacterium]
MITLSVKTRDIGVKAKALRKTGYIPGCIYGPNLPESIPIQIEKRLAVSVLKKKGEGGVVNILLNDKNIYVLIKDISRSVSNYSLENINFLALEAERQIVSTAKVIVRNRENIAGYAILLTDEIPYQALPADIIESVIIDLTKIPADGRVTVNDLDISCNKKLKLLVPENRVIIKVNEIRKASYGAPRSDNLLKIDDK